MDMYHLDSQSNSSRHTMYSDNSVSGSEIRSLRSFSSAQSLHTDRSRHRRTISDTSAVSVSIRSYTGSEIIAESNTRPTVFVSPPPKNLICMICSGVFSEPYTAVCGHTFCKTCMQRAAPEYVCPLHGAGKARSANIPNLNLTEQIQELEIYCPNGIKQVGDGSQVRFVPDPGGCQTQIKMGELKNHEQECGFAKLVCPNSSRCGPVLRKDMETHLAQCQHHKCPFHHRGCQFTGSLADIDHHRLNCSHSHTQSVKDGSRESLNDGLALEMIGQLQALVQRKNEEISLLRRSVSVLSERVASVEEACSHRTAALEQAFQRLATDLADTRRNVADNTRDLSSVQAKLGVVEECGLITHSHKYKCQGTFVGHQGPVWGLAAHGDLLFSGSSDETVKVWDTASNFSCKRTLSDHRGMIHCLVVHGHKLFSGSSDKTIKVWNIDSFELMDTISGHDQPVCTLGVAGDILLSGSLKVIKLWDLHSHEPLGDIHDLNHWVRALVVTDHFVFAGSYQTVSIWPATRRDLGVASDPAKRVQVLHSPEGGSVYSLAVSTDFIIAGTFENLIHVWNAETYAKVETLTGHVGTVFGLAVLHDAQTKGRLFSAAYDRTIKIVQIHLNCFSQISILTLNRILSCSLVVLP
eukprot:gene7295-495_t